LIGLVNGWCVLVFSDLGGLSEWRKAFIIRSLRHHAHRNRSGCPLKV
jgi:hypothetical protein